MNLLNAEDQNKRYPKTFKIPSLEDRSNLEIGDIVKLVFTDINERLWVVITKVKNSDTYVGMIDNDPLDNSLFKYGDEVCFEPKNVLEVW